MKILELGLHPEDAGLEVFNQGVGIIRAALGKRAGGCIGDAWKEERAERWVTAGCIAVELTNSLEISWG